jgi:hypothetical protein
MTVPHVVMLVANDATTDAWVRESALAVAAAQALAPFLGVSVTDR